MKLFNYLLLTVIFLTLFGCGGSAKPIPITLVFDTPQEKGHYPDYFKEIVMPFSAECEDYILKPINVTRLDIKNAPVETNAWYFEQMGDNTVEFSTTWLNQYYKDSLMPKHLSISAKKTVSDKAIDKYLKKSDVLTIIYSEDAEEETYNDHTIYTSAKDINKKIQESVCGDKYKEVVVLVNPKKLRTIALPPPPIPEGKKTGKMGSKEEAIGGKTVGNPCQKSTIPQALELKEDLLKIIDTKRSYTERDKLAKQVWRKYFDKMASVYMYSRPNQIHAKFWESGDGINYLVDRLAYKNSITNLNITRAEFHRETNKISSITIVECHNASEIQ